MEQLIYPITKRFIKVIAACFGISSAVIGAYELGLPLILNAIYPDSVAWVTLLTMMGFFPLLIVSLAILCNWGTYVLLACRGTYLIRTLCFVMFLPAMLAIFAPFANMPLKECAYYLSDLYKAFLILVATAAFFAYSYTAGYQGKDRKFFLFWAISLALIGLQDLIIIFLYKLPLTDVTLCEMAYITTIILILILKVAASVLSVRLAWLLYKNVTYIASMPEKIDPTFPQKGD